MIKKLHKQSGESERKSYDLFDLIMSQSTFFSHVGIGLPGLNQYLDDKVSCSRTQCSASGETRTHNPLIKSQALYHLAGKLMRVFLVLYMKAEKFAQKQMFSIQCFYGVI